MAKTAEGTKPKKMKRKEFDRELAKRQVQLVRMQDWVIRSGHRLLVIVEGRDAAGKGGTIKRIVEYMNPRHARVVALPTPTERERTQWYFQRYIPHLPAAGEIVIFDRSWYNRAGVERVMGFCSDEEYWDFLRTAPELERMLIRSRIQLVKYWFSVSDEEQERRFRRRIDDPLRRWKLSEMDTEARRQWVEYSKAKDIMMEHTSTPDAPWWEVDSDVKRHARLNCIAHLLSQVPYEPLERPKIEMPPRQPDPGY